MRKRRVTRHTSWRAHTRAVCNIIATGCADCNFSTHDVSTHPSLRWYAFQVGKTIGDKRDAERRAQRDSATPYASTFPIRLPARLYTDSWKSDILTWCLRNRKYCTYLCDVIVRRIAKTDGHVLSSRTEAYIEALSEMCGNKPSHR